MATDNKLSIVGISPRNSYYIKEAIGFALDTLLREEENILVLIPDVPDINNYLAYGMNKIKPARKPFHSGNPFGKVFTKFVRIAAIAMPIMGRRQPKSVSLIGRKKLRTTPSTEKIWQRLKIYTKQTLVFTTIYAKLP